MEKFRYEYKELLTSVGAVSSKDLLRHISDSQVGMRCILGLKENHVALNLIPMLTRRI